MREGSRERSRREATAAGASICQVCFRLQPCFPAPFRHHALISHSLDVSLTADDTLDNKIYYWAMAWTMLKTSLVLNRAPPLKRNPSGSHYYITFLTEFVSLIQKSYSLACPPHNYSMLAEVSAYRSEHKPTTRYVGRVRQK